MTEAFHGIKVQVLAALNSPGLSLAGSGVSAGTAYLAEVIGKTDSGVSQFTIACAAVTGGCIALFWLQKIHVYSYFNAVRFARWARAGFPPVKLRKSALSDDAPGADEVPERK